MTRAVGILDCGLSVGSNRNPHTAVGLEHLTIVNSTAKNAEIAKRISWFFVLLGALGG
jgi:hypothetical protein